MTGQFFKYFDKNRDNIKDDIVCCIKNSDFGRNTLFGRIKFSIGEINNHEIVVSLLARRFKNKVAMSFSTELLLDDKSKNFLKRQEYAIIIEKLSSLFEELKLDQTEVGQFFINNASPSDQKYVNTNNTPYITETKFDKINLNTGYDFITTGIKVMFVFDNTDNDSFLSDLKLLNPRPSHFYYDENANPFGMKDNVFYNDVLKNNDFLFSINKDWKLEHFFNNHVSVLEILKLQLPKEEEQDLLDLNFAY